ncbi:MAG: hydantoinase B/oxoprolinase family protein [Chloroflexota bacterium]|nr:MAG: hydantoinase B/oxoprolinase family protein [Chloroflexota bacterium]
MIDAISLEIFKNLFVSVAEEMGKTLGRTAFSPNIKERQDFSCAVFDAAGHMIAHAAHIPVHLGAMPLSVRAAIAECSFEPGDVVILNDPYLGGTHLPDITMVSPFFVPDELAEGDTPRMFGFVASRAHHADVGGISPGSMPMSTEIFQEGLIIPPLKLVENGMIQESLLKLICRNVRTPAERRGDLSAQLAAQRIGQRRLREILLRYGVDSAAEHMNGLLEYSERLARATVQKIPDGRYRFVDDLDDDGQSDEPVPISVEIRVAGEEMIIDFTGSAAQRLGCVNAVLAVTKSAVAYVVRCLLGEGVPTNDGSLAPVHVIAPEGTVVNPLPPAAVAAGNVETSQRIVDAILGALAQALPDRIPAASQGTMNNLTLGGIDPRTGRSYAYYETIGGGSGAGPRGDGASGLHVHMTNTMNTPIEALEFQTPLRLRRYSLRRGSGGAGHHRGGEGIVRELEFQGPARVTLLCDRRVFPPYGLQGGQPGATGAATITRSDGTILSLPGKVSLDVEDGDVLRLETPGGGGWGHAWPDEHPT